MELLVRLQGDGRTQSGRTPLEVLEANLPAIQNLPCQHVHWHLVLEPPSEKSSRQLEHALLPNFRDAIKLAAQHGFTFAFEQNEPALAFFQPRKAVRQYSTLYPNSASSGTSTTPRRSTFSALRRWQPRTSLLHVADTPLPEVKFHHLPLGLGTVDFTDYARPLLQAGFQGFAILEIGGSPKSGGFGRDTDDALTDSKGRLEQAFAAAAGSAKRV